MKQEEWDDIQKEPVAESYKKLQQEKRRILLQEGESDDTEVIFWDEKIRPEDVMEGEDLQADYRSERSLFARDTSSTDKEQQQKIKEMAKLMNVNPEDLTGYKTLFKYNQNMEDGIPADVENTFEYFEHLMKKYPELRPDFDLWYKKLDSLASMDIQKMSNREFYTIAKCPQSILNVVDSAHQHLFKIKKEDFVDVSHNDNTAQQIQVLLFYITYSVETSGS